MPRPKQLRKVFAPPNFTGFRPYGCPSGCKGTIDLLYEEYEALKLADYNLLNYEEAVILMGISRATFARICESARRKIALALVEGKEIKAVYGNAQMETEWFLCNNCHARFDIKTIPAGNTCPICRSDDINSLSAGN